MNRMIHDTRIDLTVPYARKEEAKALGARWDGNKRTWYAPPGTDLRHFDQRWLPGDVGTVPAPEPSKPDQRTEAEPAVSLGEGTSGLGDVLDLIPGAGHDHWRIETTVFTARWPESFSPASPPPGPGMPSPFDLHGPEGSLIYVQGPLPRRQVRSLARMAAPGQAIRRHGRSSGRSWWPLRGDRHPGWSWVELGYLHEGAPWRQVYRLCDLGRGDACLVTAQSPERWADLTAQAAEELALSITRFGVGPTS